MKVLDYDGLQYLIQTLKENIKLSRSEYGYTTESAMTVSFTVPSYTSGVDTLDVYINGIYAEPTTDYVVSGSTVTLTKELDANQRVTFIVTSVKI